MLFSAFAETLARVIHLLRGLFDALQRIGAGFITASEGLKVTFWGSESYMKPLEQSLEELGNTVTYPSRKP